MSEQASLRGTICEHPDDDVPRLVYADWLDDNGDPEQAEFIRTQIARALVSDHDALAIREARAIRDRNAAPERRPPAPALPDGLRWGGYRRGFPWKLEVFDLDTLYREAPRLFAEAPIQALDIDARNRTSISPLTEAPWLAQVVRLEFSLGEFGEQTIATLTDSPHVGRLTELIFEFGAIRGDGLARLLTSALAGQLRTLGLQGNFFPDYGSPLGEAFAIAAPMPRLSSLDLSGNRIGPIWLRPLIERRVTPSLRELNLSGNQLVGWTFSLLWSGDALSQLESLWLAKTEPGTAGMGAIVSAPHAENFRALHLASNRLGPVAVKHLCGATTLTGLRVLDLADNLLNDRSVTALACSPHLAGLLALSLRRVGIGDAGARALLDSPVLSSLIHLDLHDNAFSPAVVEEIRHRFGHFSASDPQHASVRKSRAKKK